MDSRALHGWDRLPGLEDRMLLAARGDDAYEAQQLFPLVPELVQLIAWDEDGCSRTDRLAPILAYDFSLPRKKIDLVLPGMTMKRRKTAWCDFKDPHVKVRGLVRLGDNPSHGDALGLSTRILGRNLRVMHYFHGPHYIHETKIAPACFVARALGLVRKKGNFFVKNT